MTTYGYLRGLLSPVLVVAFRDEMQSMDEDRMQRVWFCRHAATRIVENRWRQHMIDSGDGKYRVSSSRWKPRVARVGSTWQWGCCYIVILLKTTLGYAQTDSSGWKPRLWPLVVGSGDDGAQALLPSSGVSFEEPRCPCGFMRGLIRIWSLL